MSVQTLQSQQINSFVCPCNISGAITGTSNIYFTRFNNIIYLSFPGVTGSVGSPAPTIVYTPTVTIPSEYAAKAGVVRPTSVANNAVAGVTGQVSFANSFAQFTFSIQGGGNFSGTSGVIDNTLMWNAPGSF